MSQSSNPSLVRRALAALGVSIALLVAGSAAPSVSAPVLSSATTATAHAANPASCVRLARKLVGGAAAGNPWLALTAARNVPGCGDFNASAICAASRTRWGGWARYIVRLATWGRYSTC